MYATNDSSISTTSIHSPPTFTLQRINEDPQAKLHPRLPHPTTSFVSETYLLTTHCSEPLYLKVNRSFNKRKRADKNKLRTDGVQSLRCTPSSKSSQKTKTAHLLFSS